MSDILGNIYGRTVTIVFGTVASGTVTETETGTETVLVLFRDCRYLFLTKNISKSYITVFLLCKYRRN